MNFKNEIIDYLKFMEKGIFDYIYRPNDDSYLFLQALDIDFEFICKKNPLFFLEIG